MFYFANSANQDMKVMFRNVKCVEKTPITFFY